MNVCMNVGTEVNHNERLHCVCVRMSGNICLYVCQYLFVCLVFVKICQ